MKSTLTVVLLITLNYLTPLFAQFDSLDSDADGVADMIDLDDDNDGILDQFECYEWSGLVPMNVNDTAFDPDQFLLVRPSDFGLSGNQMNINATHDFSNLFGMPSGSIIVTVSNASILDGTDRFSVSEDSGPASIEVSGTFPAALQVEQGQEFGVANLSKTISFPSGGADMVEDNGSNVDGDPVDATVTLIDNTYTLTWGSATPINTLLLSKRVPSSYNEKIVEFDIYDQDDNTSLFTTFFFRIKPTCDYDLDGVPNTLDLDSDNDGCLDAVEGATDPSATDFPGSIPDNDELVNDYLVDASGDVVVGTGSDASNQNLCGGSTCAAPATDVYPGVVLNPTPGPHSGADIYWYQHVGSSQNAADIPEICSIVMPVEFVYFSAKQKDQSALLEWATASEYNNSHFEIERSIDGNTWQLVTSIKGAGFTSTVNNYRYTDSHVAKQYSLVYYRVKQVDFDGQSSYTNMASVTFELHDDIKIYPNPVIDLLHVDSQRDETIRVELYDVTGRMVLNTSESIINVSNQFNGLYTLRVYNDNGQILKSERVIISK